MAVKQCSGCQAEMDSDAIFCNECGQAQPTIIAPPPPPIYEAPVLLSKTCPSCGNQNAESVKYCSKCAHDFRKPPQSVFEQPATPTFLSTDDEQSGKVFSADLVAAVRKRYREGYLYARFLNGFGGVVVAVGIIIGVVVALVGITAGAGIESQVSRSTFGGGPSGFGAVLGFIIFLLGAVFGGLFIIFGILIRAAGQHLKASFDGAVSSSPFLTDLDRAEMMSLPTQGYQKKTLNDPREPSIRAPDNTENDKFKAVAAYGLSFILGIFWIIVPIVLFLMAPKDDRLVRFHSLQSVLVTVSFFVLGNGFGIFLLTINSLFGVQSDVLVIFTSALSMISWIGAFVVNFLCMWKAYNEEEFKIPLVGDLANSFVDKQMESLAF